MKAFTVILLIIASASPAEGYLVRVGNRWQRIIINDPIKGPGAAG
jgi:hypothetical protein